MPSLLPARIVLPLGRGGRRIWCRLPRWRRARRRWCSRPDSPHPTPHMLNRSGHGQDRLDDVHEHRCSHWNVAVSRPRCGSDDDEDSQARPQATSAACRRMHLGAAHDIALGIAGDPDLSTHMFSRIAVLPRHQAQRFVARSKPAVGSRQQAVAQTRSGRASTCSCRIRIRGRAVAVGLL
jgi:hypothetical protein